jgi:hypothetical protein
MPPIRRPPGDDGTLPLVPNPSQNCFAVLWSPSLHAADVGDPPLPFISALDLVARREAARKVYHTTPSPGMLAAMEVVAGELPVLSEPPLPTSLEGALNMSGSQNMSISDDSVVEVPRPVHHAAPAWSPSILASGCLDLNAPPPPSRPSLAFSNYRVLDPVSPVSSDTTPTHSPAALHFHGLAQTNTLTPAVLPLGDRHSAPIVLSDSASPRVAPPLFLVSVHSSTPSSLDTAALLAAEPESEDEDSVMGSPPPTA